MPIVNLAIERVVTPIREERTEYRVLAVPIGRESGSVRCLDRDVDVVAAWDPDVDELQIGVADTDRDLEIGVHG